MVEQEMLSYASNLYGQSLIDNTKGKNSVRRQAMVQFLSSARSVTLIMILEHFNTVEYTFFLF